MDIATPQKRIQIMDRPLIVSPQKQKSTDTGCLAKAPLHAMLDNSRERRRQANASCDAPVMMESAVREDDREVGLGKTLNSLPEVLQRAKFVEDPLESLALAPRGCAPLCGLCRTPVAAQTEPEISGVINFGEPSISRKNLVFNPAPLEDLCSESDRDSSQERSQETLQATIEDKRLAAEHSHGVAQPAATTDLCCDSELGQTRTRDMFISREAARAAIKLSGMPADHCRWCQWLHKSAEVDDVAPSECEPDQKRGFISREAAREAIKLSGMPAEHCRWCQWLHKAAEFDDVAPSTSEPGGKRSWIAFMPIWQLPWNKRRRLN